MQQLVNNIKQWGYELGFQQLGISDIDLSVAEKRLQQWLANNYHGELDYMHKHGLKRSRPELLHEHTLRIISVRMDYLPHNHKTMQTNLDDPTAAYISRYALGRDYHKLMRNRLQKLADKINNAIADNTEFSPRVFVDSAPVLEKAIAEKAGLGWIGKHSNVINAKAGSWFFLGELFINLPLPIDEPAQNHCGSCSACISICPTQAIVAPYQVDARRCISYLTIELYGSIPVEYRRLIGNRIYGCDDCQLICPWNKFAHLSKEKDFNPRHQLNTAQLIDVSQWTEQEFLIKTEGSAIRRLGYERWLRNIAVALGNAPRSELVINALNTLLNHTSPLIKEHVLWALDNKR
jgi:epoxyqueuosine reductase